MNEEIERLNLDGVVRELDKAMQDARFVVPRNGYAGLVRNKIVEAVADYLNTLPKKYLFEYKYKVNYK